MDPSTTTTTTTPPPPPTSPPPPPPPPKPLQSAQEYYSTFNNDDKGLHLGRKFHNIDDVINFKHYMRLLQDVHTRNFVLDFGDEDAWCAVNLREEDFGVLLGKPVCTVLPKGPFRYLPNFMDGCVEFICAH